MNLNLKIQLVNLKVFENIIISAKKIGGVKKNTISNEHKYLFI